MRLVAHYMFKRILAVEEGDDYNPGIPEKFDDLDAFEKEALLTEARALLFFIQDEVLIDNPDWVDI